jgi:hypothetical protein
VTGSIHQRRGVLKRKSLAHARFVRAQQLSAEGVTKEQASRRLNMTDLGFRNMLYRETGSTQWPIKEPQ